MSTRPLQIKKRGAQIWLLALCLMALNACTSFKPEHLRLTPETLAKRQLQSRVFDTEDEAIVLAAGAAVLQDLGFLIDESEKPLGVIVASKERSAIQPLQVAAAVILTLLTQEEELFKYDKRQIMRVCLVATPGREGRKGMAIRVTFQRIVFLNDGTISKSEALGTPEIYQEFFAKLSKSLFLEAEEL